MKNDFYTVEHVSKILNIHPKTIQRYIREGKLGAIKVGKGWRISGNDLSLFTERNSCKDGSQDKSQNLKVIASSVIDIKGISRLNANRLMNTLTASLNTKPVEFGNSALQTQYIERESTIRITLWGDIRFMSIMMDTIAILVENNIEE